LQTEKIMLHLFAVRLQRSEQVQQNKKRPSMHGGLAEIGRCQYKQENECSATFSKQEGMRTTWAGSVERG
jgi:hypothetical protein